MKDKDLQSEISHIRSLMERSTKFTPLSGLSGIMAGVYAFLGATVVWSLIKDHAMVPVFHSTRSFDLSDKLILQIYIIAATVLLLSVSTAIWLTLRKIEKRGESTRNAGRKELLFSHQEKTLAALPHSTATPSKVCAIQLKRIG